MRGIWVLFASLGVMTVASPASASFYVQAVMSDSPLAYWRLDDTAGPTILDHTSNGNDGTITGAVNLGQTGATADGNAAAEFAGGSVNFPTVTGLRDNFSIEFWLNPETRSNYNQSLGGDGGWGQFSFHTGNNGPIWAGPTCCGGGQRFTNGDLGNGTMELDEWQHFVFTFEDLNATQGTATLYKDGAPLVSRALNKGSAWTSFNLRNDLDGLVDEVAIYDYALPAERVAAHFSAASSVPEPGTFVLMALGLFGLCGWVRARRSHAVS